METRTYKVYEFSELTAAAKGRAKQDYYEREDYPTLQNDILEELKNIDTAGIFVDVKLIYSLGYSQGDGLSFEANVDLAKFLDCKTSMSAGDKKIMLDYIYGITSTGNTGRYFFCSESDIVYDLNYQADDVKKDKLFAPVFKSLQSYYMDTCRKLEKYGYAILEYRMTDDEFSDFCDVNEYRFLSSGKIDFQK